MDSENKLNDLLNQYKLPLALGLVGLVLFIGGVIASGIIPKTFIKSTKTPLAVQPRQTWSGEANIVKVDVSGAVATPGVYSLSSNDRVEEAIKAAGGIKEDADPVYVSKSLNLAQKLSDGMKVYIPKAGDIPVTSQVVAGASIESSVVNINNASASELADKLPGVGEVTAQKIIEKRPYVGIEELLTKKAVTRSVYEKIKGIVSVY